MKKIFITLSLALMFVGVNIVFTSCSKDDDQDDIPENIDPALIGTWEDVIEEEDCREVITCFSDGTYVDAMYDLILDPDDAEYCDEKGAYSKHKGSYTASKGVLTITMEYDFSPTRYKDKEWHKVEKTQNSAAVHYEIIDGKVLKVIGVVSDTGKEVTATYNKIQ